MTLKKIPFDQYLVEGYPDSGSYVKMGLSPDFAAEIASGAHTDEELIAVMKAICRFSQHIQFEYNRYLAELGKRKRRMQTKLMVTIQSLGLGNKGTDRSRAAAAFDENPELGQLDDEIGELEYHAKLREKMSDLLLEDVQIIKRELDRRNRHRI